jgi:hypothetical protein
MNFLNPKPIKIQALKVKPINLRKILPNKREIARSVNFTNQRIREPISAQKRKEALRIAKNKCQYPLGCTIKEGGYIKLHIHHKNWKNDDNRLSNLMVLCGTHHGVMHKKDKRIVKKDYLGRMISQRIVKRDSLKKNKKSNNIPLFYPKFKF